MPFGLGFFATAGAGAGAAGSFDLLASQVLTSPAANITFSNLATSYASTYQHLQLRIVALHSADQNGKMNFNNDTGANYSYHQLFGNGSSVASNGGGGEVWMQIGYGPNSTTQPVVSIIDLLDPFETTKYKTIRTLTGSASSTNNVKLMSGSWRNTDAISTIVVAEIGGSGSYKTGSRFSLYGIKAA
jgi:hypothetical protein